MAKDPAVLFYTADFLAGTSFFSDAERGQYIRLLCEQHQLGGIPENHMISVCGSLDSTVANKFIKGEDGKYYNKRMREEAEKRRKYCESRSNNKSGRPKKQKSYDKSYENHMNIHMENENIDEDLNENSLKGGVGEKINFQDMESEQWFMSIRSFLDNKVSYIQIKNYWKKYQEAMIADDDLYRDAKDYRAHFRNWIKKQVERNGQKSSLMKPKGILNGI